MARFVYVNGHYFRYDDARVHPEDRGFQFADAIYEVCELRGRTIVDETRHMDRLERSLRELEIELPMSRRAFGRVMRETVRRNRVVDGIVYLQVSRGAGPRDFLFSGVRTPPTVVCLARAVSRVRQDAAAERGIAVKSVADLRWGRCDIKTVMLLPASMAKERARAAGAQDAWFVGPDGFVREGASNNVWIVTSDREIVTPPANQSILRGVTRTTLIDLLQRDGFTLVERAFTIEEAQQAKEAFITSASNLVMPVVEIDGKVVGNGHPGHVSGLFREKFHEVAEMKAV